MLKFITDNSPVNGRTYILLRRRASSLHQGIGEFAFASIFDGSNDDASIIKLLARISAAYSISNRMECFKTSACK